MLTLRSLGTFQVLVDEQPMAGFVSNKVRALLAYLSVEAGQAHSREALAGLLWADWPQASAQGNLRYALSNLRKLLSAAATDLLIISRQSVQFNCTDQVWVDVDVFQKLLSNSHNQSFDLGELEAAISLYRGDFLEGLTISDSAEFEEWRTVRRGQFHRQMLEALHHAAEIYVERGEYDEACQHAWRGLELEPWDEEGHRQLMRALTLDGRRDAALAQYAKCRQVLAQELDIEPSEKTVQLSEEIRDGRLIKSKSGGSIERTIILSNVPVPLSSFIGRKRELAEIERLLGVLPRLQDCVRLLTLVGAGGCGKTRLAIEAGQRLSATDRFPNGIWWVDLARLSDPTLLMRAVATLFGLREVPGTPLIASLINYLNRKRMLLLLDNCEHLIEASAELAENLLQSCPELRILATSREALDIEGETTLPVNPLSLPDFKNPPPPERLVEYEAARLFVERAQAAVKGFALTAENASAVIQICCQLDGIPLAIELAARRLKAMPIEQIAAQLDNRFLLLTNGTRTALPHHRTLRGVLDWSYDYLSEKERSLLRQVSVFSGGWTLEAVEYVAGGNLLEGHRALLDKSLIMVDHPGQAARYYMLETIRQYGREKSADAGEDELVRSRHLEYYLQFAERSGRELRGTAQNRWTQQVELELDNIRTALEWSVQRAGEGEAGLCLAIAMSEFWNRRSYYREERQWLERTLTVTGNATAARLRAWGEAKLVYCAYCLGDLETMQLCLDDSWSVFRELADMEGMALVMQGRAILAGEQKHDLATAISYLEESLRLLEQIGDKWNMAETLRGLGRSYYLQGDLEKAKFVFNKAVRFCRETSNTWQLGMILVQLGFVALLEGDYESARSSFEESRHLANEWGDRDTSVDVLSGLGELARCEENYTQARAFYEEGLIAAHELGTRQGVAYLQRGLGHVALHYGEHRQAMIYFSQALQYWLGQDMHHPIAGCLAGIAGVAATRDEMERAAQLLGKVDALITETSPFRSPSDQKEYQQSISLARTHLGEEQYRALHAKGYSMTLEQILELGMGNLEDESSSDPIGDT